MQYSGKSMTSKIYLRLTLLVFGCNYDCTLGTEEWEPERIPESNMEKLCATKNEHW